MLPAERGRTHTFLALTMLLGCAPWSLQVLAATAAGSPPTSPGALSVTPPQRATRVPPLEMLEYLGDLQQDDEGWFGPEDITDEAGSSPRAAAQGDEHEEVPKQ